VIGEHLKQQVEDRLDFYETGVNPAKNLDVMRQAVTEAADAKEKVKKEKVPKERKNKELKSKEKTQKENQRVTLVKSTRLHTRSSKL